MSVRGAVSLLLLYSLILSSELSEKASSMEKLSDCCFLKIDIVAFTSYFSIITNHMKMESVTAADIESIHQSKTHFSPRSETQNSDKLLNN